MHPNKHTYTTGQAGHVFTLWCYIMVYAIVKQPVHELVITCYYFIDDYLIATCTVMLTAISNVTFISLTHYFNENLWWRMHYKLYEYIFHGSHHSIMLA